MNIAKVHAISRASAGHEPAGVAAHECMTQTGISNARKIRLLVLTSLYPNAEQPRHGIFVEERLRHLIDSGRIEATVIAPVPWFPLRLRAFGSYAAFARMPAREERYGIDIRHPRYPVIPKLGMSVAPALMVRAVLPVVGKIMSDGEDFDLIDAHYFYPDGVAAERIGSVLNRPVVITARGSDLNVFPDHRSPRRQIQHAAQRAAAVVTVSQVLKDRAVALGLHSATITVLRNGVDLDRFAPQGRDAIRDRLGLTGAVWLTAGHLIKLKGVHLAIEALAAVPGAMLLIAGRGPEEWALRALVDCLELAERVRFLGSLPQTALCEYYNAADALIHASSREGMPNVVLESLACGTPVVAAPFDGVTELLDTPDAGEIATERTSVAIAAAWHRLRERAPSRAATRRHAEHLGWQPVVEAQCALYARVLAANAGAAKAGARP